MPIRNSLTGDSATDTSHLRSMTVMRITSAFSLSYGEQFGEASRHLGNHLSDLMLWSRSMRD